MSLSVKTQGGGVSTPSASIFITGLSENDVVTATNYGNTVQGKWDSTENRFKISPIKFLGLWTVTATNGEQTITQDVLVDAIAEYEIEMGFPVNYLMLYDYGDECEDVVGGYTASRSDLGSGAPVYSFNADHLSLGDGTSPGDPYLLSKKIIPLSEYQGVGITAQLTANTQPYSRITCGVKSTGTFIGVTYGSYSEMQPPKHYINAGHNKVTHINNVFNYKDEHLEVAGRYSSSKLYALWLFKEDDWGKLCDLAGVDATKTLSYLFSDIASLTTILENELAVSYMLRSCTGNFMSNAIKSSVFLTALESSPYKSIVLANKHWSKFLAMVGVTA